MCLTTLSVVSPTATAAESVTSGDTYRIGNAGSDLVVDVPNSSTTARPHGGGPGGGDGLARAVDHACHMAPQITRVNPDQLHVPPGYHHITVVEAGRTAFLAGQCPIDRSGSLVGEGDLDAQVDQVVANSLIALAVVGAEPAHVVRSTVYVVSDDTAVLAAAWDRLTRSAIGDAFTTASTLLGVTRLGFRGQLVEVDLTAALSG